MKNKRRLVVNLVFMIGLLFQGASAQAEDVEPVVVADILHLLEEQGINKVLNINYRDIGRQLGHRSASANQNNLLRLPQYDLRVPSRSIISLGPKHFRAFYLEDVGICYSEKTYQLMDLQFLNFCLVFLNEDTNRWAASNLLND